MADCIPSRALIIGVGETATPTVVDEILLESVVLVRHGEVLPLDGQLWSDRALVDESSLTCEPYLLEKVRGDEVPQRNGQPGPAAPPARAARSARLELPADSRARRGGAGGLGANGAAGGPLQPGVLGGRHSSGGGSLVVQRQSRTRSVRPGGGHAVSIALMRCQAPGGSGGAGPTDVLDARQDGHHHRWSS